MKKVSRFLIAMAIVFNLTVAVGAQGTEKMSLKDSIFHALKNNLGLQIQKTDTRLSFQQVKINTSIYVPNLTVNANHQTAIAPSTNIYDGVPVVETSTDRLNGVVNQLTPYGGQLSLTFYTFEQNTNALSSPWDPYLANGAQANFVQPLLKNFGKTATNFQIYIARNNHKVSKYQLQENIVQLVYDVEAAYWELVFSYQNLEATKKALDRAKNLLNQNEIKVKVGTAAPIDILGSKAEVARQESAVIQAERGIQTQEENLKRILNLSKKDISVIPIDRPTARKLPVNANELLKEALGNRTDIKRAELEIKNQGFRVKFAKNQALPDLQFTTQFISSAAGGTNWTTDPSNPSDRTVNEIRTSGDTWSDVFSLKNKDYTFALRLVIPLGFKKEKAELATARFNAERAVLQYKQVENNVYSEVRQVVKELETNRKLVEANNIAVQLQEENLKAELKKLAVGISTNYRVLEAQRNLADAETQALRSTIDYTMTLARVNQRVNRTFKVYDINFSDYYDK
ncbi:MAG: TolC family protein [bacterium]|nr:TolC family protein [bacterium]